jgi:hypothetical protein
MADGIQKEVRMSTTVFDSPAAWKAEDLHADENWIFTLDARATRDLAQAVHKAKATGKSLFDSTTKPLCGALPRRFRSAAGYAALHPPWIVE